MRGKIDNVSDSVRTAGQVSYLLAWEIERMRRKDMGGGLAYQRAVPNPPQFVAMLDEIGA